MKSKEPNKIKNIKICRIAFIALFLLISYMPIYFEVSNHLVASTTSMALIGETLSILIASLLVIVSISVNSSYLLKNEKNWKTLWDKSKSQLSSLLVFLIVFCIYLLALCLTVASILINEIKAIELYFVFDFFIFVLVFSFLVAFRLPFEIINIQGKVLSKRVSELKAKNPKGEL